MTRTYALATATVIELSPPQVIETARAAGYQAVGLRLNPVRPGEVAPDMFGDTAMKREALARLRDSGLRVVDVEVFWLDRQKRVRDLLPVLELAHELGARHALTPIDEADPQRAADLFAALCELAAPLGITCALEFMSWIGVNNLASARDVLRRSGQANSMVLVDSLHLARSGGHPRDLAGLSLPAGAYVQICDAHAERPASPEALAEEAKFDRLCPGDGALPLVEFVAALPADITISIEVPSRSMTERMGAVERARTALEKTQAVVRQADSLRGAA